MADEPIPQYLLRQIADDAAAYFREADRRERDADERARRIADAHTQGWDKVARAINDGFALIAQAVRDRR